MVNEIMEIVFNDAALSESSGRGCFRLRINGRFGEASEDGAWERETFYNISKIYARMGSVVEGH